MNPDLMKPSVFPSVEDVKNMPEDKWLKLVGELAYPQRASTMVRVVKLAKERSVQHVVETGSIRGCAGDGQSTLIFSMLAARFGCDFDTFEINPVHMAKAKEWIGPFNEYVDWNLVDSVAGMSRMTEDVGLVYLDSYDYDSRNPRPCQLHQLAEIGAVYGKLTPGAIIVLDDASLDNGGKVAMASDFLINNSWKQNMKEYQVIFTRQ